MDFSLRRIKLLYFAVLILLVLRRQTFLLSASIAQFNYENNLSFDPPNVNVYQSTLNQEVSQSKQTKAPVFRKWAYAFVVGGCDSRRPEYRGFLYNIAIAAEILQESGSKADIIALIQMSAATNEKSLPEREAKLLEAMNVKVEYIPKFNHMVHENFYSLMIEKFRILQMTKYSRVIFMDADVMPFCSLDYLFELSEPESGKAKLKENVVISYSNQPAHGGFFMLRPGKGDYDHIQKIIRETEEKSMNLSGPEYWDVVEGWGHKIMPPDRWRSSIPRFTSTNWSWHGVHADQGLLYHWTKYVKQSVTLIINHEVEHWTSLNGTATLESAYKNDQIHHQLNEASCGQKTNAPYTDFNHFTGKGKPWVINWTHYRSYGLSTGTKLKNESLERLGDLVNSLNEVIKQKGGKAVNQERIVSSLDRTPVEVEKGARLSPKEKAYVKWFAALDNVERRTGSKIHLEPFLGRKIIREPPVGTFPKYKHRINHIKRKSKNNWTAYDMQ